MTEPTMSETPRTDAVAITAPSHWMVESAVPATFARVLERELTAALRQLERQGAAEGLVQVPVEPTPEMLDAGWDTGEAQDAGKVYRAMLRAAESSK